MPYEIERKFLVKNDAWKKECMKGMEIIQGYMFIDQGIVRARVAGNRGFITIKGRGLKTRREYEYEIPVQDAHEMIEHFCEGRTIEKQRYFIQHEGVEFTVDVFSGDNAGLVLAEVELEDENQEVQLPEWVGAEVTDDARYHNSNLLNYPCSQW